MFNRLGVLRVTVVLSFIERTFTEAAEEAAAKSGARADGRSHERSRTRASRTPITDES